MKWAIVFYAMLGINGEVKEHISWGITFNHHEQCISSVSYTHLTLPTKAKV